MSTFNQLSPVNDFRITLADGTRIECTSELQDTLAFEGRQKRSLVSAAGQVPLTTDLLWLAWHAACRENKTEIRQFAKFVAQVTEFEARAKEAPDFEFDGDDLVDGADTIAAVVGANPTHADQYDD